MAEQQATVEYREVQGFPGYRVGSDGSVWTRWRRVSHGWGGGTHFVPGETWRRMRPHPNRQGQLRVTLCPGRCERFIHRLVLEAFVGPCPPGMECCHFPDRNPANCALSNLRWDTRAGNMADKIAHGTDNRGEKHAMAKIGEGQVRSLRAEYVAARGSRGKIPNGLLASLAVKYGLGITQTKRIIRGEGWKHVV